MSRKHVRWLYGELPGLVNDGVLSAEAAEALRHRYGEAHEGHWRQVALTLCAVLGALLIGLGIIFLLAYNWQALSRPVRTVLALAPLVLGQGLAAWVLSRPARSAAWREGAAVLLLAAVVASIALVQQTYHMPGDVNTLLLPWLLLAVPVVYLLRSSVGAVLYLAGALVWAGASDLEGLSAMAIWLLAIPLAPHAYLAGRGDRYALRPVFLGWAAALWVGAALVISLKGASTEVWIVAFPALYAVLYAAGRVWFEEAPSLWRRPLAVLGASGVALASYVLTFRWVWDDLRYDRYKDLTSERLGVPGFVLTSALVAAGLVLAIWVARQRRPWGLVLGAAPVLAAAGVILYHTTDNDALPAWLFNAYVFGLGAGTVAAGVREKRLALANLGTLLVVLLVVARLLDSEMGFLVKGIACLAAGAGFLGVNLVLHYVRRRAGG